MTLNENNDIEILKKKTTYFLDENIAVHIVLKTGKWLNGSITKLLTDGFIVNEFEKGPMPIYYSEIKQDGIEPFTKPKSEVKA